MKTPELAVKMRATVKRAGKNRGWGGSGGVGGSNIMNVMFLFIKSGMRSPQMIPLDVSPGNEACSFQRG